MFSYKINIEITDKSLIKHSELIDLIFKIVRSNYSNTKIRKNRIKFSLTNPFTAGFNYGAVVHIDCINSDDKYDTHIKMNNDYNYIGVILMTIVSVGFFLFHIILGNISTTSGVISIFGLNIFSWSFLWINFKISSYYRIHRIKDEIEIQIKRIERIKNRNKSISKSNKVE